MDASIPNQQHYYEPRNGHGLKHDPFNAIIAPRPIGWISSRDTKGNAHIAMQPIYDRLWKLTGDLAATNDSGESRALEDYLREVEQQVGYQ